MRFPLQVRENAVSAWDNRDGPRGATNTTEGLTHSSDLTREGLAMKATRTCIIPDCDAPIHARGWCNRHYLRWWTHGDPSAAVQVRGDDRTRFWSKVDQPSLEACWEWSAARDRDGYGTVWFRGAQCRAPRVAWTLANGVEIPNGQVVRHTCDNPPCVNPAHLILGTPRQNDTDRLVRERAARGSANGGGTKLTPATVRAIRSEIEAGGRRRQVAARHGVSKGAVDAIITGRNWRWVS